MKKLLIVNPGYFGSYVDTIYHVKYLIEFYEITYVGIDENIDYLKIDGVNYILLNKSKQTLISKIRFLFLVSKILKFQNFDLAIVNYFLGSSLLHFSSTKTKIILDIRTSFIFKSTFKRFFYNFILTFESLFYKNITVISQGVKEFLKINKRAHILPLGAPIYSFSEKSFDSLNLIYVGTFKERNIHETIYGFAKFYSEYNCFETISYTIIGSGTETENIFIVNLINKLNLSNCINYLGFVNHNNLDQYLKCANIGVSYIPITDFFNFQPPTKTFEYLMSGLVVIGTRTFENSKIINNNNGVLIDDNSDSFYNALVYIRDNRRLFSSREIHKSSYKYSWESIVKNNLLKYLDGVISKSDV